MSHSDTGPPTDHAAIEQEARATWAEYLATRERIEAGELPWSALADFFVDDAVFIDPAWGRVEGIDAIREFLVESMKGLEDWRFPERWTMFDGNRIVTMFDQILPSDDGVVRKQAGISTIYYAGDGKFSYEMDLMNMAHINEDLRSSSWRPSDDFNFPPGDPVRDYSVPGES
jgi:nuclear transport factor 2 (NTF2) superfamily protein